MKKSASTDKYIEKIKPIIRKTRFSQLTIDDIARCMDISKGTLYKNFSTRDEIIEVVVAHYINYLDEADTIVQDENFSFAERFQKTFEHSLKCVIYVSDLFLIDLKESYPYLFENLVSAQQNRIKNLESFFKAGMNQGIFNRINAVLFMVQDDAVLRRIMVPSFSIKYDLTLKQALMDFYQMKKYQLFKPEYLNTVNDSVIEKEIVQTLSTIT
ncbi:MULTISPECIES: TetR/AcrR family transcriptional regulator [Bacillus]|uniref:TetR family transcriptional regulator n=2 Tax=Bacillus TaxID=1386 RepID=A0A0M4FTE4_9BACI|nr:MULTISPECIES: TetR/AcrR family transcriptional regulator [Bacillus]ALC82959.1 TetR family transcriptional regulator [Bacillus gobiensis]MBP1081956.1 AcrR family transcriptional regulator [Bacillus capparidis]MED1096600.1 TetR/AcrR family transcriptional regulator [Bacillus capparidis]